MARYFHATRVANVGAIKKEGLKPVWDFVYLTDSLDSALRWMGFRIKAAGDNVMAVIEVEAEEKDLQEGMDHSPLMQQIFGCGRSLISEKRIPKSRIKKVHYYSLDGGSPK